MSKRVNCGPTSVRDGKKWKQILFGRSYPCLWWSHKRRRVKRGVNTIAVKGSLLVCLFHVCRREIVLTACWRKTQTNYLVFTYLGEPNPKTNCVVFDACNGVKPQQTTNSCLVFACCASETQTNNQQTVALHEQKSFGGWISRNEQYFLHLTKTLNPAKQCNGLQVSWMCTWSYQRHTLQGVV